MVIYVLHVEIEGNIKLAPISIHNTKFYVTRSYKLLYDVMSFLHCININLSLTLNFSSLSGFSNIYQEMQIQIIEI